MEKPCPFTELPHELFQLILKFLSIQDLGKLDIAFANHQLNRSFHGVLYRMVIPSYASPFLYSQNNLPWVVANRIMASEIFVSQFSELELNYITYCRDILTKLRIGTVTEDFKGRKFPKLTSLAFDNLCSKDFLLELLFYNPQIEHIAICSPYSAVLSTVMYVSPSLKHLDVSNNFWFTDDCILELIKGPLDLYSLNISGTRVRAAESIRIVSAHFPNLHSLLIDDCYFPDEIQRFCFEEIAVPSVMNSDPDIQFLGLQCLHRNYFTRCKSLHQDIISLNLVPISIEFLHHERQDIREEASSFLSCCTAVIATLNLNLTMFELAMQHQRQFEICDNLLSACLDNVNPIVFPLVDYMPQFFSPKYCNTPRWKVMRDFIMKVADNADPQLLIESTLLEQIMRHYQGIEESFARIADHHLQKKHLELVEYLMNLGLLTFLTDYSLRATPPLDHYMLARFLKALMKCDGNKYEQRVLEASLSDSLRNEMAQM